MTPADIFHAFADQCETQGELMQETDDFSSVIIEGRFNLIQLADRLASFAPVSEDVEKYQPTLDDVENAKAFARTIYAIANAKV